MRAIWKGAVSFGLVSIAVRLYSATEEKDIRFHQVHRSDGGRIRYKRVCEADGEEVAYDEIAKGYDLGGGEMVVLTDDDFKDLPLSTSRAIDVLEFVPSDQIDPMLYAKAYYLEPDKVATKPYVLLREALAEADRVAIVKVALRQREQLATLRVRDDVLVLNTMLWPDEVRTPEFGFLDEGIKVRPQELAMATSLIDSMTADFSPDDYSDDYREALQQVIEAKVSGKEIVAPAATEEAPSGAIDLMAALRASVDRARAALLRRGARARAGRADPDLVRPLREGDDAGQEGREGRAGEEVPGEEGNHRRGEEDHGEEGHDREEDDDGREEDRRQEGAGEGPPHRVTSARSRGS
ncbi:Ku protein [Luedemannella flava]